MFLKQRLKRMSQQTPRMNRQTQGSLVDHIEWEYAAAYGIGAWLVSLVASYATLSIAGAKTGEQSTLDVAAWVLHTSTGGLVTTSGAGGSSAQLGAGPFTVPVSGGGIHVALYSTVESDFWALGVAPHFLLTAFVTVTAGYLLARRYAPSGTNPAPRDRLRALVGGASLTAGFALATIAGMVLFDASAISYESDRLLLAAFVYPTVFGSAGAAIASGISTRSFVAFASGLGSFVLGTLLFKFVEDPAVVTAFEKASDLPGGLDFGLVGDTAFAFFYVQNHGIAEFVPKWYAFVVMLAAGALVAYLSDPSSPLTGAGKGARIAWGYAPLALLTLGAWIGGYMNELRDFPGSTEEGLIQTTNAFYAAALPTGVLLGGILWPVVLGALGGAIGAFAVQEL